MWKVILTAAVLLGANDLSAAEYESWAAYTKANRYTCPGPFDTMKTPRTVTVGGKKYEHNGYKMTVQNPDTDTKAVVGIISAIKDVSPATKENLAGALLWFKEANVEWVVANGDLALEEFDLEEILAALGESGFPILLSLGNSESKGSFARVYKDLEAKYPNLLSGVWLRQIVADDVEFWTMPGYYDKRFKHQGAFCNYKEEDVEATKEALTPAGTAPVVLISHGPPQGIGKGALDRVPDGANVGDPSLNDLIRAKNIPFGIFGHILEAGGLAVGADMKSRIQPNKVVKSLHLNAGSLSGDPWGMNDGSTSNGMALILTLDGAGASYQIKKFHPKVEQ